MFPSSAKRRDPHFIRHVLMLFTFAVMLLSPIAANASVADQVDAQRDQMDQATETPPEEIEEPPVEVTEEPVVEVTEEPLQEVTEEPIVTEEAVVTEAAAATFQLTINVYRCDHPTFDPYFSSNAQMVIDQCTGPGSGTFEILTTMPVATQTGSQLEFTIGPDLAIQEHLQPGYDNSIANCFILDLNGNTIDQIGPGEANGGFWKVGGVQNVHCDWYQVDRGGGAVYVVNMACPSTAALFPEPSMTELVSMCTEPAGQKQFFVVHGAGLERMGVSGGEFNDVLFEAIQTGPIEIWMDDPAAFDKARVFCQVATLEGVEVSPFAEVSVGNFRATGLTLVNGQRIHCSWFNIQEGPGLAQPDDPTPTQEPVLEQPEGEPGFGSVAVNKHACPEGFAAYAADMFEMAANCHDDPGTVNFTTANVNFNYSQAAAATGGGNYASFSDVPTGSVTITEELPATYGTPVVFCKVEVELDLSDVLRDPENPGGRWCIHHDAAGGWPTDLVRLVQRAVINIAWWRSVRFQGSAAYLPGWLRSRGGRRQPESRLSLRPQRCRLYPCQRGSRRG